jgi:hypothetical protein
LKFEFVPETVIFADGTKLDMPNKTINVLYKLYRGGEIFVSKVLLNFNFSPKPSKHLFISIFE